MGFVFLDLLGKFGLGNGNRLYAQIGQVFYNYSYDAYAR
jgi:hypothetical protein